MIGEDTNCSDPSAISLTGLVAVEATGGFGQWGSVDIASIAMPQGNYTLKLCVTGGVGTDVDSITFDLVGYITLILYTIQYTACAGLVTFCPVDPYSCYMCDHPYIHVAILYIRSFLGLLFIGS